MNDALKRIKENYDTIKNSNETKDKKDTKYDLLKKQFEIDNFDAITEDL